LFQQSLERPIAIYFLWELSISNNSKFGLNPLLCSLEMNWNVDLPATCVWSFLSPAECPWQE
jgi:hypothetical protein